MRRIMITCIFLFLLSQDLHGNAHEVGRQIGHIIGNYFDDSLIKNEDIVKGIQEYQNGMSPPLDEKTFFTFYETLQSNSEREKAAKNLKKSEAFLKQIQVEMDVLEMIADQLYVKQICSNNKGILLKDRGLFHIQCSTIHGKTLLDTRKCNTPIFQDLKNSILGFSLGVKSMRECERRILYIHPLLAYGDFSLIDQNIALIIDVELISIE